MCLDQCLANKYYHQHNCSRGKIIPCKIEILFTSLLQRNGCQRINLKLFSVEIIKLN